MSECWRFRRNHQSRRLMLQKGLRPPKQFPLRRRPLRLSARHLLPRPLLLLLSLLQPNLLNLLLLLPLLQRNLLLLWSRRHLLLPRQAEQQRVLFAAQLVVSGWEPGKSSG